MVHSPSLEAYKRNIQQLEDKLNKLTQEKERLSRDSSRMKKVIIEKDLQSKSSLDRLKN